jgi:urea transporter
VLKDGRATCLWWPGVIFLLGVAVYSVWRGAWLALSVLVLMVPLGWAKGYAQMKIEEGDDE